MSMMNQVSASTELKSPVLLAARGGEGCSESLSGSEEGYVTPSTRHSRYLEMADGRAFIPVGLNLCFPRHAKDREQGLGMMFKWLDRLSEQGGNFARIFMGQSFFDIERGEFGAFDEERGGRLDAVLDYAWQRGVRLKLTIDLFRTIEEARQAEVFPGAVSFSKPNFHVNNGGPFESVNDFLLSEAGRKHFLRKLDWLAARYARHPGIFGWDLWNEMNAVSSVHWKGWTEAMLPELKKRFPRHLPMQTLGSMDGEWAHRSYSDIMTLPANEISQVHRYLDGGASWEICHGPVDVMMADAVANLLRIAPDKPAILAEGGAVENNHAGPWRYYPHDKEGIVLHDVLFAPFFAGAAGCGQAWHWQEYVDPNNLWWHYGRFVRAVAGMDPIERQLMPRRWDSHGLRVYVLEGPDFCLAWCRDVRSNWRTELEDGVPAMPVRGAVLPVPLSLGNGWLMSTYNPWTNESTKPVSVVDGKIELPTFTRSLVLRLEKLAD